MCRAGRRHSSGLRLVREMLQGARMLWYAIKRRGGVGDASWEWKVMVEAMGRSEAARWPPMRSNVRTMRGWRGGGRAARAAAPAGLGISDRTKLSFKAPKTLQHAAEGVQSLGAGISMLPVLAAHS